MEVICDNRSRNFFKEMKKLYPKVRESNDIADTLPEKYDDLYNYVPSDEQHMSKV